jgi:hypothetical protein
MRATENAASHGERCREDARVHYEEVNVHAHRAGRPLPRETVLEGSENQLPDPWEPNSVSELEPLWTTAGSTPRPE